MGPRARYASGSKLTMRAVTGPGLRLGFLQARMLHQGDGRAFREICGTFAEGSAEFVCDVAMPPPSNRQVPQAD